jgi:hypothetical protein
MLPSKVKEKLTEVKNLLLHASSATVRENVLDDINSILQMPLVETLSAE